MGVNDHREPKRKSNRKQSSVGEGWDAAFRGYINVNLSEEQKEAWGDYHSSAHAWAQFDASVSDGVNLSIRYDAKGQCFLASATQRREGSPNAGLVVTARGGEPLISLTRLLYTLAFLGSAERWEDIQPLANPDRW